MTEDLVSPMIAKLQSLEAETNDKLKALSGPLAAAHGALSTSERPRYFELRDEANKLNNLAGKCQHAISLLVSLQEALNKA
jgi:hypothetical protein